MKPVIFFDVDNTLLKGLSGWFTTILLIRRGVLKKRHLAAALFYKLIGPVVKGNVRRLYQIAIQDMAGRSMKEMRTLGRECFEKNLKKRLYREAAQLVRDYKKKGHPVYLVTCGPTMTIEVIADFLGVDGHFSCGPEVDDAGTLINRLQEPFCYREGKVEAAGIILKRLGGSWQEAHYYADDMDDLFLLEKVGHPHCVNPHPRLARLAAGRGWPVHQFRETL